MILVVLTYCYHYTYSCSSSHHYYPYHFYYYYHCYYYFIVISVIIIIVFSIINVIHFIFFSFYFSLFILPRFLSACLCDVHMSPYTRIVHTCLESFFFCHYCFYDHCHHHYHFIFFNTTSHWGKIQRMNSSGMVYPYPLITLCKP